MLADACDGYTYDGVDRYAEGEYLDSTSDACVKACM